MNSLARLDDIERALFALQPRLEAVDLTYAEFLHWLFGRLNLGQWLALFGLHEERHIVQIWHIVASPEFLTS